MRPNITTNSPSPRTASPHNRRAATTKHRVRAQPSAEARKHRKRHRHLNHRWLRQQGHGSLGTPDLRRLGRLERGLQHLRQLQLRRLLRSTAKARPPATPPPATTGRQAWARRAVHMASGATTSPPSPRPRRHSSPGSTPSGSNVTGSSVSCAALPGGGSSPVAVDAAISSGLAADTTYHYRVSATNSSGTGKGGDAVFKTS